MTEEFFRNFIKILPQLIISLSLLIFLQFLRQSKHFLKEDINMFRIIRQLQFLNGIFLNPLRTFLFILPQ